jgi:hypothetical protein
MEPKNSLHEVGLAEDRMRIQNLGCTTDAGRCQNPLNTFL